MSAFDKDLSRLYSYAMLLADQDTRDSQHEGMKQEMVQLYARVQRARRPTSSRRFFASRRARSAKFIAAEPRLKVYEFYLKDIERRATHTLSEAEEKLLAEVGAARRQRRRMPTASSPTPICRIRRSP